MKLRLCAKLFTTLLMSLFISSALASNKAGALEFRQLSKAHRDQFLSLTNWKRSIRTIRYGDVRKRQVIYKSLNLESDFKSPAMEFTSVLKHFYLDGNFKCERFAIYEFMADVTGMRPASSNCDNHFSTFIFNQTGLVEISFYTNRITKLSYLMASNGSSAMSRFGHSMFYVAACKVDKENCPLRQQVEFVLGVAADVDDLSPGFFKGIFGGYAAKIDFMSLSQVKQKYNYEEFRDLYQYDLKIDGIERRKFISHALSLYETKDMGRYKFFSANCATESYKILRAALGHKDLRDKISTPKGLLKELLDAGLINEKENRVLKEKSNRVQENLRQLSVESFVDYLQIDPDKRSAMANLYHHKASRKNREDTAVLHAFVFLESMAFSKENMNLLNIAAKNKDASIAKEFSNLATEYKGWYRTNNSLIREGKAPIESRILNRIDSFYRQNFSLEIERINSIAMNIKSTKDLIKEINKRNRLEKESL